MCLCQRWRGSSFNRYIVCIQICAFQSQHFILSIPFCAFHPKHFILSISLFNSLRFLLQEEYIKNRRLSQLGSSIADGVAGSQITIPVDQALFLQTYGMMGKTTYTGLRLALLRYGLIFPPYDETSQYKHHHIIPSQLVR